MAGRLPEFMVPAAIVVLDALPVTVNGKLDTGALPAPQFTGAPAGRGPQTPAENVLCGLLAELLGADRVGAEDGFFDLGGDSIMSMQLVARARAAGLVFSPRDVFRGPDPGGAGAGGAADGTGGSCADVGTGDPSDLPLVSLDQGQIEELEAGTAGGVAEVWPLPPLQEGLLFHALYDADAPDVYTVQHFFDLAGPVDPARLRAAGQGI